MIKFISLLLFLAFSPLVFSCPDFLKKYPEECELSDRYLHLKKRVYKDHNINVDYLTGYRARRLIDKDVWQNEQDRIRCRPERAYLPDPDVWINWEKGAMAVSNMLVDEKLAPLNEKKLNVIDRERIKDINTQSVKIEIMGWVSTRIKGARPGRIRKPTDLAPNFPFNCIDGKVKQEHVENVKDFDIKDNEGNPLISTVYHSCGPLSDAVQGFVHYTSSENVEPELEKLTNYINENVNKFRLGTQDPEYSPLEFIADVQRWFVAIHPFGDGNGRTSRFIQDYLLAKFGLPYAPSGNLQNDVLLSRDEYRELFKKEIAGVIEELEGCRSEFSEKGLRDVESLTCECRPMYLEEVPLPVAPFIFEDLVKRGNNVILSVPCNREISETLNQDFDEYLFNIIWSLQDNSN